MSSILNNLRKFTRSKGFKFVHAPNAHFIVQEILMIKQTSLLNKLIPGARALLVLSTHIFIVLDKQIF